MATHTGLRRTGMVLLAATTTMMLGMHAAVADPPSNGCPRGFGEWDVDAEPYQMDNAVDANGDGIVCARQTGDTVDVDGEELHIQIFRDNDLYPAG